MLASWEVYNRSGREAEALEALLRAHEVLAADGISTSDLRAAYWEDGMREVVRLTLDHAPEMFGFHTFRAGFEIFIGDTETALRSLERAVAEHEAYSAWLTADPVVVDALREEPRFQALVRRVRLPQP